MSNLLTNSQGYLDQATPFLAGAAGLSLGGLANSMLAKQAIDPVAEQANNLQRIQSKALKGGAVGAGALGLGLLAANNAKPISDEDMELLRQAKAEGKFAHMGVANFFLDPSMFIDVVNHVGAGGMDALSQAGGFLQNHAQPLLLAGTSILGSKARGKAAKDVATAAADTANTIKKVGRNGLLAGGAAGVTGGLVGGKLISDKLKERGAIRPLDKSKDIYGNQ